ncbi:homocysteine S-methyltransferase, putative [Plasmodium vinckei brucechwatti]|uniref:Homocysteine S-methyltransferase, putative n=1 Tax=Plasmodium vinckei brucechwatti TaxID=119398 RepID=A0A6V7T2I1_PLAVN|nr:homocysteine S-methyltransferase, putative [Plasmodium vinckei brucechwatti]
MSKRLYTLDGGKISEFERLGLSHFDFLSCQYNEEEKIKGIENLENIHLSYLLSGSNIITTNTYQVNLHSLRENNISIDKGKEIINTYIDIAYDSCEKYKQIKKRNTCLYSDLKTYKSPYDYVNHFQNIRQNLNVCNINDKINIQEYFNYLDLQNDILGKKIKITKSSENFIAFSNGSYNSSFRNFTEYSGVFQKGKISQGEEKGKNKTNKLQRNQMNKLQNRLGKQFDITLNLAQFKKTFKEVRSPIEMIPKCKKGYRKCETNENNNFKYDLFPTQKLFNYGIEYYIDVTDEEILANCKFKLESFCRNKNKLNFFSLLTCTNIREVFTFYNTIKYYATSFNNNVIINFFCNDPKNIGCSNYSFFDIVSLLLYLDSYNKYIYAIGLNCVNINYVYNLFLPFKKYMSKYNNINIELYKSENQQINPFIKNILNDIKKNRYIYDINFFCSPNKTLDKVSFDNNTVNFQTHSKNKKIHVYNNIEKWIEVGINGFGGCCYYTPYDISLINYGLSKIAT